MSELAIRAATAAEHAPVGERLIGTFLAQYARKPPDIRYGARRLKELRGGASRRKTGTVLVAEEDGALIGTIALVPRDAPGSHAWIEGSVGPRLLAVALSHHGRGLSRALLNEMERWEPASCMVAARPHMRREVEGMARLYRARGYLREFGFDLDLLPKVFLCAYTPWLD